VLNIKGLNVLAVNRDLDYSTIYAQIKKIFKSKLKKNVLQDII